MWQQLAHHLQTPPNSYYPRFAKFQIFIHRKWCRTAWFTHQQEAQSQSESHGKSASLEGTARCESHVCAASLCVCVCLRKGVEYNAEGIKEKWCLQLKAELRKRAVHLFRDSEHCKAKIRFHSQNVIRFAGPPFASAKCGPASDRSRLAVTRTSISGRPSYHRQPTFPSSWSWFRSLL